MDGPGGVSAGYGSAQALPGPLFTLTAYLGTAINSGGAGWLGGVVALNAMLIPSMLLVIAVLPHWNRLRAMPGAQAALMGANATVVGILLAAFYLGCHLGHRHGHGPARLRRPALLESAALGLVALCALVGAVALSKSFPVAGVIGC